MQKPESEVPGATDQPGDWVFVAGATGRIGSVVAEALARNRTNVVVHDSGRTSAARELAEQLREHHGVQTIAVDAEVTDVDGLDQTRKQLAVHGVLALRALVNCTTGYSGQPTSVAELSAEDFRRVVDVDLVGSFLLVKAFLPLLSAHGNARVVLSSSVAGLRGRPRAAHLCAAKAGVQGLVVALANDLGPHGVAVNAVAPGPVIGRQEVPPRHLPAGVAVSTAHQVASVIVYLASGLSSSVQGQVLVINGGQP